MPIWMWPSSGLLVVAVTAALSSSLWWGPFDRALNSAEALGPGSVMVVPDNRDPGADVTEQFGDGSGETSPTGVVYTDPLSAANYRNIGSDGTITYNVPIDGACPVGRDGRIGAPSNYRHACSYEHNGAVVYTSHAVRGARVGALENIRHLVAGQIVRLDDQAWRVREVATFPADMLPDYLFEPGMVVLLTCHIDAAVDAGAAFDKSDVVILEKV